MSKLDYFWNKKEHFSNIHKKFHIWYLLLSFCRVNINHRLKVKYPNISTFKWNYRYDVIVQKILFWIYNNNSQPRRYPLSRMTCFKSVNSKFQIMHESWYPRISSSELYIFKNIIINYRIKQYKNQYGCQDRTFTTVIYLNASLLTTI